MLLYTSTACRGGGITYIVVCVLKNVQVAASYSWNSVLVREKCWRTHAVMFQSQIAGSFCSSHSPAVSMSWGISLSQNIKHMHASISTCRLLIACVPVQIIGKKQTTCTNNLVINSNACNKCFCRSVPNFVCRGDAKIAEAPSTMHNSHDLFCDKTGVAKWVLTKHIKCMDNSTGFAFHAPLLR